MALPLSDGSSSQLYVMVPPLANPSTPRPTTRQPSQLPAERDSFLLQVQQSKTNGIRIPAISRRGVCGRPLPNQTSPSQSSSRAVIA
jgi:hypothetical protein